MSNSSVQDFVNRIGAKNRITFGDVRRLQRTVLPNGLSSRDEAELLLRLDRQIARADAAWADWLVSSIVDFVVWSERPTGVVEGAAALWLRSVLTATGTPTKAGRRIAREIRREAERVEEPMASFMPEEDIGDAALQSASSPVAESPLPPAAYNIGASLGEPRPACI